MTSPMSASNANADNTTDPKPLSDEIEWHFDLHETPYGSLIGYIYDKEESEICALYGPDEEIKKYGILIAQAPRLAKEIASLKESLALAVGALEFYGDLDWKVNTEAWQAPAKETLAKINGTKGGA